MAFDKGDIWPIIGGMFATEIQYVRGHLQALGHAHFQGISDRTGVSVRTIKRIAYNEGDNFTTRNIDSLSAYFRAREPKARRATDLNRRRSA